MMGKVYYLIFFKFFGSDSKYNKKLFEMMVVVFVCLWGILFDF